jgi:hypothetical protein
MNFQGRGRVTLYLPHPETGELVEHEPAPMGRARRLIVRALENLARHIQGPPVLSEASNAATEEARRP